MRITETHLRRIIRSVIKESIGSEYKPALAENEIMKFVSFIVRFCEVRDKEEIDEITHNINYRGTKEGKSEEEIESEIAEVVKGLDEEALEELDGAINGKNEMLGPNRDRKTRINPYQLLVHLSNEDLPGIVNFIKTHSGTEAPFGTYTVQKDLLKVLKIDKQKLDSLKKDAMYYKNIYDMGVEGSGYIRNFSDTGEALKFSFDWGKQVDEMRAADKRAAAEKAKS